MPLLSISYSPSGRSICKNCFNRIPYNSIRIGATASSKFGYSNIQWYHEQCFNKLNLWGVSELEIGDLDNLCVADQNRIKDRLKQYFQERQKIKELFSQDK